MKMVGLLTALSVAPTLALAPSGRSAIVTPSPSRATPVVMSKWLNQGPKPQSSKLAKIEPKELAKFEPLGAPSSQMQANSAAAAAAALAASRSVTVRTSKQQHPAPGPRKSDAPPVRTSNNNIPPRPRKKTHLLTIMLSKRIDSY